jgi:peroxiredoxin
MTIVFGTVLPWLLLFLGAWLGFQLVRQNGRILVRLEAIEQRMALRRSEKPLEPRGLTVGTVAPEFELPDLSGVKRRLTEFRGNDLLLIFFNPKCGFCTKMAADLAALPVEGSPGRPVLLVVTTGDAEENRKLIGQHGIRCVVLLQKEMEVAGRFLAQGTPMGYRIDPAGRIASPLTVGGEALLQLAARIAPSEDKPVTSANGSAKPGTKGYRSLEHSRLNRNGLKAGDYAPEFRLPRIDGGELSLAELRGGRVLLVFSDPHCGPCAELAPQLQKIHQEHADLSVLVVSRGDADENRAKAADLGLTFPIVLQQKWEVSLKYAMFATPIGYLIDAQGVLASDVAVGIEPILNLAVESGGHIVPSGNGREGVRAT